jgi:hypothetical protein
MADLILVKFFSPTDFAANTIVSVPPVMRGLLKINSCAMLF